MFKDPRSYAELLLQGNREKTHEATITAAKTSLIEAARVFPQVPARFFADVFFFIDVLADEALEEAQADEAELEHFRRVGSI